MTSAIEQIIVYGRSNLQEIRGSDRQVDGTEGDR